MESCKVTARRFLEESCPDCFLGGGGKVTKTATEGGLDEHRSADGAGAGKDGQTNGKKHDMRPRVGIATSDVDQDRDGCREQDQSDIVEHDEIVVSGSTCVSWRR